MIRRFASVRERRKVRVRAKIKEKAIRPRLSVFRSHRYLYAQIIDDKKQETLVAASEFNLKSDGGPKTERARLVGQLLAKRALKKGIKKVIFDRGPYQYHGRVKALAEGAREGGLIF